MSYDFTRTGPEIQAIHDTVTDLPNRISNENLISNSDFSIAGSVTNPPDATPRSYSAGDELFAGFFAQDDLVNVTYINGELNGDKALGGTGQIYNDVYKTEKQKLSTSTYIASIASSNSSPVEAGASFVDNVDYWRVTFDMSNTFSVKFEQDSEATKHELGDKDNTVTIGTSVSRAIQERQLDLINIEDFGAKADYFLSNGSINPSPTDNSVIINSLIENYSLLPIRSEFASTHRIYIPTRDNKFFCANSVIFSRNATLKGGGGLQFGASCLIFAPNVTGLIIPHPGGATAPVGYPYTNGGTYSIIEGIKIECSDPAASTSGYGVLSNTTFTMRDVWVDGFAQENMFINANAVGNGIVPDGREVSAAGNYFGNANLFVLENIKSWNSKSDALRILGKDANAGIIRMFDGSRSSGCGILDQSTLGNTYIGCHNAINGTKIENNGEFYQCRKYHTSQASNEPGIGVDWQEYWQKVVATTPDAQWSSGVEYFRTGSFHSVNDAANNTLIGHYSEGGIQGVIELSKNDVVIGGTLSGGTNRDSVNVTVAGASGNSPWEFQGYDGTYKFSNSVGGLTSDLAVLQRFYHEHDVSPVAYQFEYSVPRSSYEYSSRHSGVKRMMAFTGQNWSDDGYSGVNMFFESGIVIGGSKSAKVSSAFSIANITGEVVKGEVFILTGANAGGKAFAKVTTSGIAGSTAVIKECGVIDA